jgi:hypothetical protein
LGSESASTFDLAFDVKAWFLARLRGRALGGVIRFVALRHLGR